MEEREGRREEESIDYFLLWKEREGRREEESIEAEVQKKYRSTRLEAVFDMFDLDWEFYVLIISFYGRPSLICLTSTGMDP